LTKLPSLLVLGTDTGVGKTVVTALFTKAYRQQGLNVMPFKPVACGSDDASFLASHAQVDEADVSLYKFKKPLSPHLAAEAEGVTIKTEDIIRKLSKLQAENDAVIVEGVGGVLVPLNRRELFVDLAKSLDLPVVIVARPNLGTLNHTLLTVKACRDKGLDVLGLVINRYPAEPDEAERTNPAELEKLTGLPILGIIPEIAKSSRGPVAAASCFAYTPMFGRIGDDTQIKMQLRATPRQAVEADKKYVWHPFTPMQEYLNEEPNPLMITKAEGCYLQDSEGRKYLDGVSSLWVNVHGHRKKELDDALQLQLGKVAHSTMLGLSNEPAALLAEKLVEIAPGNLKKVFYSDNGSTAVEIGLKVAYQYWQQSGYPEKKEFVSFINAYHGDTIGAVSVGGMDLFHLKFKPLLFKAHLMPAAYCYKCKSNSKAGTVPGPTEWRLSPNCDLACLDEFEQFIANNHQKTAGVVLEPMVQGAAGILTQPPGYLTKIANICHAYDVLLIVDEVATGFGRTAKMFACEHENIEPDIMALAKGITGGYLPLAATLFKEKIYSAFLGKPEENRTFFHGHTYTGNPLACAVAIENLRLLTQEGFMDEVQKKAQYFSELLKTFRKLNNVGDVRQCGLMAGIELVADKKSGKAYEAKERVGRKVILKAREKGVIIRPLGDVVVLMPPLAISKNELKKLVNVTMWAIEEICRGGPLCPPYVKSTDNRYRQGHTRRCALARK